MPGKLTIAATPIGNPMDASRRMILALETADVIAAEDTRRLRRLMSDLEIAPTTATIVSFFAGNESRRTSEILEMLRAERNVLLVSDAGMPTVSDPGYGLIRDCAEAQISMVVLPGPSAVLSALAVSGLPTDRFCFEGFLPRKSGERGRALQLLANETRTMLFFESPRRTGATLTHLAQVMGEQRRATVCRELTKTHEEIRRGTLAELATWSKDGLLGEITIVVAGATPDITAWDEETLRQMVDSLIAKGATRRDAIAAITAQTGAVRRDVYQAAHARTAPPMNGAQ